MDKIGAREWDSGKSSGVWKQAKNSALEIGDKQTSTPLEVSGTRGATAGTSRGGRGKARGNLVKGDAEKT
jgi:hypothetical protein